MILKELKINTWISGEPTNCYIIFDEESKEAMVIDPAGEVDKITEMLDILNANLKYIYVTHCHGDHIGGVQELQQRKEGKVLIHRLDAPGLNNENLSLTNYMGMNQIILNADSIVDDEDLLHLGDLELKVIHTPGHTCGGSSLYCKEENMVFTGDTLFRGTWGRTDLPTSNFQDIMNSITNRLMQLPEETIVYPGHGKSTMIREERPIYLELRPRLL